MNTFGQNGEERIAKILNEATRGLNAHGLPSLGPHKDMPNPNIASSLALPISQVDISKNHLPKEMFQIYIKEFMLYVYLYSNSDTSNVAIKLIPIT